MPKRPAARSIVAPIAVIASWILPLIAIAADSPDEASSAAKLISDLGLHVDAQPVRGRNGWSPPRKILISTQIHDQLAQLQQVAPGVKFIEISSNTPPRDIAEAEAAIGVCSPDVLEKAKKLQWIQWLGAGVERCVQQPLIRERRPLITNLQRAAGASMAEHVMAMMLMLSRNLNLFLVEQQRAHWAAGSSDMPQLADLEGKTLLVVGLGGIGTEVAKRAHAFAMRVLATRASGRTGPDYVSYVGLPEELLTLTKQADFIVNCAPLTPATTGIFNAQFFAAMKPTAYFVSVGRGRSTVTADLIAALNDKRIAGAALDVTEPEPLPADNALWRMPNVIITPHVSGDTPVAAELRIAVVRENLRRYVAGEAMLSVVDIERGY
jgi:phosphoglycerate dehydrogenase-like enzyme